MKDRYYPKITTLFIILILFIFLFVEIPETISVAGGPVVPFIYGKKIIFNFLHLYSIFLIINSYQKSYKYQYCSDITYSPLYYIFDSTLL